MSKTFACPACDHKGCQTIDTRSFGRGIRRRRRCLSCDYRFSSIEVKSDDFIAQKLGLGVLVKKTGPSPIRGWVVGYWRVSDTYQGYVLNKYDEPGELINVSYGGVAEWSEPPPRGFTWTPEMVSALITARNKNMSYLECADLIGVDYKDIAKKCHSLGIGGKRNNGQQSGRRVLEMVQQGDHTHG